MGVKPDRGAWGACLLVVWGLELFSLAVPAQAQDDARMRQLRLLCVRLSGDLTDPGGMAAFRRCLTTNNPIGEIKRDNGIGGSGSGGGHGGGGVASGASFCAAVSVRWLPWTPRTVSPSPATSPTA